MAFDATIFDYNGVLIDDEHVHLKAFREALEPLGVEITEQAYFDRYIGFDDAGGFEAMLTDAGRESSPEKVRELIGAKKAIYLRLAARGLVAFDGAAELVRQQHLSGPVLVVSGALRDEIELGLRTLDVEDLVSGIVAAEDTAASKPDPEGYLLGLSKLQTRMEGLRPERVIVFEDTCAGVQAAKGARLTCVAVGHSTPTRELVNAGADAVVDRLSQLDQAFLQALAARV